MRLLARSRVRAPSYPLARRPFGNFPRVQVREFTFNDAISCLGAGSYFSSQVFPQMNSQLGFSSLHEHSSAVTALRTAFEYEQATDWHSRLRSWRPKRRYLQWEMESALNRGCAKRKARFWASGRQALPWDYLPLARDPPTISVAPKVGSNSSPGGL